MNTVIRYRRRRGSRWRTATLRTVVRIDAGPDGLQVEVIDERTGNTRILTASRWQLQVNQRGRWIPLARWAGTTAELSG